MTQDSRRLERLKARALRLKREVVAVWLAWKHPQTPWYAKLVAAAVAGYALSPIDLIPDFIPILGYLDDLILLPAGIALAVALIPKPVMAECRIAAAAKPVSPNRAAAVVIVSIWIVAAVVAGWFIAMRFVR